DYMNGGSARRNLAKSNLERVRSGCGGFAAPGEEHEARHHDGVGVVEVRSCRGVEFVEFAFVGESHLEDMGAEALHEVGPDRAEGVAGGVEAGGPLHGDVFEAGATVQVGHAAA